MSKPHVVVVGGGLAGLAAAVAAGDGGATVTLYERAPRLGGATWSFQRNGRWYDNGQHVFLRCCTEYLGFLERLGVSHKVTLQDRLNVPVLRPGRTPARIARSSAPAPLHLARSLLGYAPLGLRDRLAAVRTALALRRLDPDDPSLDDVSFGDWLRRHGASDVATQRLWDLICLPTVNLRAEEASLALAARVFVTGLLSRNNAADIGWTLVPLAELHGDAASAAIVSSGGTVHVGSHVDAVGPGPQLRVGGEETTADAVILAVPHNSVDALLPAGSVAHQSNLDDLGASPIVNVQFAFDRPVMDVAFAAALDSPVQFVFDRTPAAGGAAGEQVVAVSLSAAFDEVGDRPEELIERYRAALCELFPKVAEAETLDAVVTREHRATFAGRPGTARLRPGPATRLDGVYLAGTWCDTGWPATMEGAVRSGQAAARAALAGQTQRAATTQQVSA